MGQGWDLGIYVTFIIFQGYIEGTNNFISFIIFQGSIEDTNNFILFIMFQGSIEDTNNFISFIMFQGSIEDTKNCIFKHWKYSFFFYFTLEHFQHMHLIKRFIKDAKSYDTVNSISTKM